MYPLLERHVHLLGLRVQVTLDASFREGGHVFTLWIPLGPRSRNENQVAMA